MRFNRASIVANGLLWGVLLIGSTSTVFAQGTTARTSKRPITANVSLPTASTEVSYAIPAATTRIRIVARGGDIQASWQNGQSGTTYTTIPENTPYCQGGVILSGGGQTDTLYLQSPSAGAVAEIEVWR